MNFPSFPLLTEEQATFLVEQAISDKASYLTWRAAWRAERLLTIADVRQAKAVRGNTSLTVETRNQAHMNRQDLRLRGHNLYLLRTASKKRSGAMRAFDVV